MPRRWQDLTTEDFRALDPTRTVAVLPVAAIEQHGPHLPVSVDATINAGVVDRAMSRAPADLPVLLLPMMPIGKSNEHQAFPGTLTLSAETLIRLWTEIGESVYRAGARKLLLLNSHGGQPQIMDIVARDLRVRLGMFVVTAGVHGLWRAEGMFSEVELKHGIHGGAVETSIMMHLAPDLVRDALRANFAPSTIALETRYRYLRAEGSGVGFGWQTQDLHPSGACGDATDADAARGEKLTNAMADGLVALLGEMVEFPLSSLKPGRV